MKENFSSVGMLKWYISGFILCIILTLASFAIIDKQLLPLEPALLTIVGLAFLQTLVQVVCFLKVGREGSPHWNTLLFIFAIGVVLMIVVGSLWIMYHLDYRLMPTEMELQKIHQGCL